MEEKKNNKGLVWLIVVLIILVLGLVGYIVYDKVLLNDKNISKNTTTNKISNNLLPQDISDYETLIWNYNELYSYYFTMERTENFSCDNNNEHCGTYNTYYKNNYNIGSYYKFIKIDNNKLYWNIDNEWVLDKNITEEITYLDIIVDFGQFQTIFVVTKNNNIYVIDNMFEIPYTDELPETLEHTTYDKIKYEKIVTNKNITNVVLKGYPTDCEGVSVLYVEADNKIFALNNSQIIPLTDFLENWKEYINNLTNTCSASQNKGLNINFDGSVVGMLNENDEKIIIKYYIELFNYEGTEKYDIVISQDNKLYIIDENKDDLDNINILKAKANIKKINENKDKNAINLILEDNSSIEFKSFY